MTQLEDNQPWSIVQREEPVFDKPSAFVYCDRRQHLLVFQSPIAKKSSAGHADTSITSNTRTTDTVSQGQTIICLERIQYIQRGGGETNQRSAREYNQLRLNRQHGQNNAIGSQQKQLEIYYQTDHPRSEYLYKSLSLQLIKLDAEAEQWLQALYAVIDEAKNLSEAGKRNRWLLREYEKLRRSSVGLTFDSISGWLNSHLGLIGEKANIENQIKRNETFRQSNEITDSMFKAIYNQYVEKQQETLIKSLMSDSIEENRIPLQKFASRITNNALNSVGGEFSQITKFLRLTHQQREISLRQCANYLWSDANSAFDPTSRTEIVHDMDQPLNHYWISSSHNTYLAKTQVSNPASVHCYIQALLKGCRCIEIDALENRTGPEPEISHKNTRIRSIPLRDVLEAIHDYGFVASEYPIIISIENHCSAEQRVVMARMFVEIFGDSLIQSPLSANETRLPSPNQLKRKIILKDSKGNVTTSSTSQVNPESSDDTSDVSSLDLEAPVQLFDFTKKTWLQYNYHFTDSDLFLTTEYDRLKNRASDEENSDFDHDQGSSRDELTQIWYHKNISHLEAERLLLSNAGYEVGTFLIRKSVQKKCYCISFLVSPAVVRSTEIKQTKTADDKYLYALAQKEFESIPDLISYYQTYDLAVVASSSGATIPLRLGKPLPRPTWRQELEQQTWYQPHLTRVQADQLLCGTGDEMTFLIRESSRRSGQEYSISIYSDASVRHSPIYRDGSDLMLMSLTFTSLVELVNYFSRKPIFQKLTLGQPAIRYSEFVEKQRDYQSQGLSKGVIFFKTLPNEIELQIGTLRAIHVAEDKDDQSVEMHLCIYEEDRSTRVNGYRLRFDTIKDWEIFSTKICPSSGTKSPLRRRHESSNSLDSIHTHLSGRTNSASSILDAAGQQTATEYSKLIIYCQGVKLKIYNISRPADLHEKIKSFKEMISLNYVKAAGFCTDASSMILFNQGHFTRIYPDFSPKSWKSSNFEPILYWATGCQMVALNFQMPDRPMHVNAGRFGANAGCGYVLMPKYIRSGEEHGRKLELVSKLLSIRVIAVRHLRAHQAKSISKAVVKTTIISKQKTAEHQTCQTTIHGPCGFGEHKSSSKHHDQSHPYHRLRSDDNDVDLLYFEIFTDHQEFCGQASIPIASLRTGIRSVALFDKFNERLDMSTLLVDIHFQPTAQ